MVSLTGPKYRAFSQNPQLIDIKFLMATGQPGISRCPTGPVRPWINRLTIAALIFLLKKYTSAESKHTNLVNAFDSSKAFYTVKHMSHMSEKILKICICSTRTYPVLWVERRPRRQTFQKNQRGRWPRPSQSVATSVWHGVQPPTFKSFIRAPSESKNDYVRKRLSEQSVI